MFSTARSLISSEPWPAPLRLVYVGDLSHRSGVIELLVATAMWAEQNPEHSVELNWIGAGELEGAMQKQPLPQTVLQRFLGELDQPSRLEVYAQCGIIAMPSRLTKIPGLVQEALAAGLLVMGNRRNPAVRKWVHHQLNGWLFDPAQDGATFETLRTIMSRTPEGLASKPVNSRDSYPGQKAAAVLADLNSAAYFPAHPAVSGGQVG